MELIINEEKILEECIKNKEIPKGLSINYFINLIIRQYKKYNEYISNSEILDYVFNIINNMNLNMQEHLLYNKVKSSIIKENKYNNKIRDFDYIALYKEELDLIKSLKTQREKKFIFTCYIIARLFDKDGWFSLDLKEIFKMANMTMKNEDMQRFIYGLKEKELLYEPISNKNLSLHIDLKPNGEEVIKVYEMKNLGNQIMAFLKPNYKQCKNCGKLIKIKSKTCPPKYCEECAYKINLEKQKERDLIKKTLKS